MPNLLFLYTDEQRFDTLAAYGNRRIETPNLNRLTEASTVFERAYVTQPVCTPSRSSLLTGLYPHSNGCVQNNIPLSSDTRCLPEMIETGDDVATAHHGKWHLGDEIYAQHGFQEWRATEDTYHRWYGPERDQADRSAYHHWLIERGARPGPNDLPPEIGSRFFREQIHRFPEELARPTFLAEEATRFIHEHRGHPWILYVNWLEPHMPFTSCRDDQYPREDVIVPGNFNHALDETNTLRARLATAKYRAEGFEGLPLEDEKDWRELIARYWGMVSLVDTSVGRILAALEETGQDDETILVFTSDHGDLMGSHRMLGKGFMFDESTRVPLAIRLPGQTRGRRLRGPVSQIDVVPTLLALMGETPPPELQGTSLGPALETSVEPERDVFIEWNTDAAKTRPEKAARQMRTFGAEDLGDPEAVAASLGDNVRTVVTPDGWKLNWSQVGEHELYNLPADPLELRNLVGDADQADRVATLRDRIRAWQDRTADPVRDEARA